MEGMNLLEIFRLSKTIEFGSGDIKIMGTPVSILPTDLTVSLQKALVESRGLEEAYNLMYDSAKLGSYTYNKKFIETHKGQQPRVVIEWQLKIVTLAGWGKWTVLEVDSKNNSYKAKFEKSPFPSLYGKSNYPVDFIPAGFVAGGISACFAQELTSYESKCVALGDQYCQIEVGPTDVINSARNKLWSKLGIDRK